MGSLSIPEGYHIVTSVALGYADVIYRRIPVRKDSAVIWK